MSFNTYGLPDMLYGIQVIVDEKMCDYKQVKFPRSKKKRIRRKWAKNTKNYAAIPWETVYRMGNQLLMHPLMLNKLKKEIDGK